MRPSHQSDRFYCATPKQNITPLISCLIAVLLIFLLGITATADIFQWEYIDPADPSLGKQQSTILCVDGAGKIAEPSTKLQYLNLTQAFLANTDLSNSDGYRVNLSNGDLSNANLYNVYFRSATISNAVFSGSNLTNATLDSANMTETDFSGANLNNAYLLKATLLNANFTGATLTNTDFRMSNLTNAIFTNSDVRGAFLSDCTSRGFTAEQLYSTASYKSRDLNGIVLYDNNLTGWNFANQNLSNAYLQRTIFLNADLSGVNFYNASLSGTDFTDSRIDGAIFGDTLTSSTQLYSTWNYKNADLEGISFERGNLSNWIFSNKNLSKANLNYAYAIDTDFSGSDLNNTSFYEATLTGSDFTDSDVRGTVFDHTTYKGFSSEQLYSTASYKNGDLSGIILSQNNLTGWNLANQNLRNASFRSSTLTGTDFTNSDIRGANFGSATAKGFIATQLYSTTSYKQGNLTGVQFNVSNNISNWNFSDKNLSNADFAGATMTGTDFSFSDLRGARFYLFSGTIFENSILADGSINGLELVGGDVLRIWDYQISQTATWNSGQEIAIKVKQGMSMAQGAQLEFIFSDAEWCSTISFDAGIDVLLDGVVALTFADGVNLADMVGVTFDLFDWDGVVAEGAFSSVTTQAGLVWDTSSLYTTGEVMLINIPEPVTILLLGIGAALIRCKSKR